MRSVLGRFFMSFRGARLHFFVCPLAHRTKNAVKSEKSSNFFMLLP